MKLRTRTGLDVLEEAQRGLVVVVRVVVLGGELPGDAQQEAIEGDVHRIDWPWLRRWLKSGMLSSGSGARDAAAGRARAAAAARAARKA